MAQKRRSSAFQAFCAQVFSHVVMIPSGRVTTYGDIARAIPCPAGIDPLAYRRIRARWVGYALKRCPPGLPWWRVVDSQGRISRRMGFGPRLQRLLLEEEGVTPNEEGMMDLARLRWTPAPAGEAISPAAGSAGGRD